MKKCLLVLFVLIAGTCLAQEPVQNHQVKLNFIAPGFTYELGLAEQLTLNVDAMLSFYFHLAAGNNNNDEDYFLGFPFCMTTLQYYFNRKARERRGKRLFKNSGLFIGPALFIQGPDIINTNRDYVDLRRAIGGGGIWGVQRTFGSGVSS